LEEEMIAMSAQESNDKDIPFRTDAYYEERARQEEIYLEEIEEELRMVLESDDLPSEQNEGLVEEREHAAEELIIGDSDEPPLSEAAVEEMLRTP
jgi:hypothetical protein